MVKEETIRMDLEEIQEVNYRKPIMIGAGLQIAFFILFGYKGLSLCFQSDIYRLIFGFEIPNYLFIGEVVISSICMILGSFGLYYFISGLRKKRKSEEKMEKKNLQLFIILSSIFMITANLFVLLEAIFTIISATIENLPLTPGLNILFALHFSSLVVFVLVMIVIIIQNYFLIKNGLIDLTIVRRPIVHFFILGSLLIWGFFQLNHYFVMIRPPSVYFHIPFICSQFLTSFLAAGVYLELIIK